VEHEEEDYVGMSGVIDAYNRCKNMLQDIDQGMRDQSKLDFTIISQIDDKFESAHPVCSVPNLPADTSLNTTLYPRANMKLAEWVREYSLILLERFYAQNSKLIVGTTINTSSPGGQLDLILKQR
jgi:hypothetical protein